MNCLIQKSILMIGMAQRGSQMGDTQGHQYGAKSITPFKTPSHSVNIPSSQAYCKDGFGAPVQTYHHYAGSSSSTHLPSQPYEVSQAYSNNQDLFGGQKRNSISQLPTQETSRNDNRVKSERFFKELQGVLSTQLDRVREEIAKDLGNLKDVDSNIKKGLGLDLSSLTDEMASLKDDLKTAITSFSNKLEESFKEQGEEVNKVTNRLTQHEKRLRLVKCATVKTYEESLSNTFNFLKHEISDLSSQIGMLKDQMKQDTQFAIDRIKEVRNKYTEDFSQNSQRQALINEKLIALFQDEKHRQQSMRQHRCQPANSHHETAELACNGFGANPHSQHRAALTEVQASGHAYKLSPRLAGNPMDAEAPVEVQQSGVKKRGRPKRDHSAVFDEGGQRNGSRIDHEDSGGFDERCDQRNRRSWANYRGQHLNTNGYPNQSCSGSKDKKLLVNSRKNWRTAPKDTEEWFKPASIYKEFSGKFDYLRLPPEELEKKKKLQNKKGKGKSRNQSVEQVISPREDRLARRREMIKALQRGQRKEDSPQKGRTIINKDEQLAKDKAVIHYGEKSASVITQVSKMVKKAEKTVGKMRGRVNLTVPITNS
jgi:hypothetical protein